MLSINLLRRLRRFLCISEDTPDIQWSFTPTYQRRVEQIKNGWIFAGIIMLIAENIAFVVGITLFSCFLSLAYLERED